MNSEWFYNSLTDSWRTRCRKAPFISSLFKTRNKCMKENIGLIYVIYISRWTFCWESNNNTLTSIKLPVSYLPRILPISTFPKALDCGDTDEETTLDYLSSSGRRRSCLQILLILRRSTTSRDLPSTKQSNRTY